MLARWLMEERERPRQVQEDTRSRRPQIVAQHEVRMIFRFSIQSLTLALPLTKPRSRRPRVMPNAICPSGLHSLATAFCSTPRTTRFGIFLQRASQPSRPRVSPQTYVFTALCLRRTFIQRNGKSCTATVVDTPLGYLEQIARLEWRLANAQTKRWRRVLFQEAAPCGKRES